jgi:hypothetical protein
MAAPNAENVEEYLGDTSYTITEIGAVLAAEKAAQAARCRVPADADAWPADLTEALFRRCARNLAMRGVPLAILQGDAEVGSTVLPGQDPEVRRLEAPHRRLTFG